MASKTRSVDVPSVVPGKTSINFGNVEALRLQLADESNLSLRAIKDLLIKVDATLIRLEGKYDANQESK